MDRDAAYNLLANLVERAESGQERTFLTTREITALTVLLSGGVSGADVLVSEPISLEGRVELLVPVVTSADIPLDTILCIDFGTSFSKAFVTIDDGNAIPRILDLQLGDGNVDISRLLTPSELLIDGGVIYFGSGARRVLNDSQASPDRLIDSIKQYMTLGTDVSNLARIRMNAVQDPGQDYFQRDILLLYLAHLTYITERALAARGISINVRRRFAHPAWSDNHRASNEAEMRLMMAEAIVLARSLGEKIGTSLSVQEARSALDAVKMLDGSLPVELIAEPVREATAAGAGALIGSPLHRREPFLIIDIGAGTTDVAGCLCVNNPDWDRPRVFEVSGAAAAIKSAGNVLDSALLKFMLERTHLAEGSEEYRAAAALLMRERRRNKEQIFQNGGVIVELPTGAIVEAELPEFLEYAPVKRFAENLLELISASAGVVAGDGNQVTLVSTGGGARLPMLHDIVTHGVESNGKHISFTWRDAAPAGMADLYPDLIDPYPQIAVALGGALPNLPEQKASVSLGISQAPKRVVGPMYKS